jgi:hypothetical protein
METPTALLDFRAMVQTCIHIDTSDSQPCPFAQPLRFIIGIHHTHITDDFIVQKDPDKHLLSNTTIEEMIQKMEKET